jgi:hypothetical protein
MNLLDILRTRIEGLPEGNYTLGLKSVLQHIEVAEKHFSRGQTNVDDTAFTDAIYRTNQAFEGSLKEAFRVLAVKDPSGESPSNIENYLQNDNILRPRVLAQFTNYRKEWRNPSTHDYRLNFDEDEALLAIVTVSAFAIVLIDQITERISFERAKANAAIHPIPIIKSQSLLDRVPTLIEEFITQFNETHAGRSDIREVEIEGALAGFLASAAPDLTAQIEAPLAPGRQDRADLLLGSGTEKVILEIKRPRRYHPQTEKDAIKQVSYYMAVSGISRAILFVFNVPNTGKVNRGEHTLPGTGGRIIVISTEAATA